MTTTSRRQSYEALHAALAAADRDAAAVHAEALDDKEEYTAREIMFGMKNLAVDAFNLDVDGARARRMDRRDAWRRRQQVDGTY